MNSKIETSRNQKCWFLLLYVVVLELIFYVTIVPEKTNREILIEHKELLEYTCCIPRQPNVVDLRGNVVFLKSHTNASSIVFNILSRFSLNYGLDVFIPNVEDMETINDKYNMIFQFDNIDDEAYEHAYEGALTLTILSHPISTFQSLYNDYRKRKPYGTLRNFISESSYTLNPISTHLGLKKEDQFHESEIQNFIHEVERKFDYVMIYEHLDISLVLLSNLLGWPLEYVANIFPTNRVYKYNLTEISKIKIMELNLADTMLYEYFLEKLENCAIQYGVSPLLEEMNMLSSIVERVKQHCSTYNESNAYEPRTYWSCDDFNKTEAQFIQEIKEQQIRRMEREKAVNYLTIW